MGIFKSIFGNKNNDGNEPPNPVHWVELTDWNQLEDIHKKSETRAQVIFKHSTTCGVSRMVKNMFEKNPVLQEEKLDLYFLDVHRYREISNEIAEKFQVRHQSPQLLVLKKGEVVAHSSHGAITEVDLGALV